MGRWLLGLPVCLLVLLLNTPLARADVTNFTIKSFNADYVLDNRVPGGKLTTTEDIDVDFRDYNHGILRAVPKSYHGWDTGLQVIRVSRDGQSEPFTTEDDSNGNEVIKIGSPDRTITGEHAYHVVYTQERVVNFDGSQQSFYWDINGTAWAQPFESVIGTVHVKGITLDSTAAHCYTGSNGSQQHDCTLDQLGDSLRVQTTRLLAGGETLTVEVPLPAGMFAQPTWQDYLASHTSDLAGLAAGMVGALVAWALWLKYGRDYSSTGVVVPEYDPPEGLSPAEVGMLADYNVDGRDISATLIDLAVRKYVRIHDDVKSVLFFKPHSFSIELLNANFDKLKDHENALLIALFPVPVVGHRVELNQLDKTTMRETLSTIRTELKNDLVATYGLIEAKGMRLRLVMMIAGTIAFFAPFWMFSTAPGLASGLLISSVALFAFGVLMPRRSHAGDEMYRHIKGLKLYMKVAEADRMKMLESVDRPFAAPAKTVELFSKLLPYAVALGVEKSWSKQFDDVLTNPPDWYAGNYTAFNAGYFATNLTSITTSFSRSFEASSGASGGAGGGGGGGGGAGW